MTLSETDVNTLDFNMSSKEIRHIYDGDLLWGGRFILNSANYNGMNLKFEESTLETYLKISFKVLKTAD